MRVEKRFRIKVTDFRRGEAITRHHEGTLGELIDIFYGTLYIGKSYELERGNKKINLAPKTIKSLVGNLNNATNNKAVNGYSGTFYTYEII